MAASAHAATLAGLAFSGDSASRAERFPYSLRYEQTLQEEGRSAFDRIRTLLATHPPRFLKLEDDISDLKGTDQAVVTALS